MARVWDIVNKGRIEEGYDADLVLVDMNLRKQIRNEDQHVKCKWSLERRILQGWASELMSWVRKYTEMAS